MTMTDVATLHPDTETTTTADAIYILGGDDRCVAGYLRARVETVGGEGMAPGIPVNVLERTANITYHLPNARTSAAVYAIADGLSGKALSHFLSSLEAMKLDGLTYITLAEAPECDAAEAACSEWCAKRRIPLLTLRCGMVIGNGMEGRAKRLAEAIANGAYWHIPDVDSECSAIVADDVAQIVIALGGTSGTMYVSDGRRHSMAAIINGMAHRLNDKRVLTLAPAAKKWLDRLEWALPMWKRLKARRGTDALLPSDVTGTTPPIRTLSEALPGFEPRNVLDYLRS